MTPCDRLIKSLMGKLFETVSQEMNKKDTQTAIRDKVVSPLLNIVYKELQRYVYAVLILIFLSLLFSLSTFVMSVMFVMSTHR
jgi:hypothetical protein